MRSAKRLRRSLDDAFAAAGLAGACVGLYSNPAVHFDLPDETQRAKVNTLFIQEMARRGVHCLTTFKATLAHTQTDIEQTAQAAYRSVSGDQTRSRRRNVGQSAGLRSQARAFSTPGALGFCRSSQTGLGRKTHAYRTASTNQRTPQDRAASRMRSLPTSIPSPG